MAFKSSKIIKKKSIEELSKNNQVIVMTKKKAKVDGK